MKKLMNGLALGVAAATLATTASAELTMFDVAKDAMIIARGEFTSLERTTNGDRLTLRCDEIIKGDATEGQVLILEPFEKHQADNALGREVIVGFNRINNKFYFDKAPFAHRSFWFEGSDVAANGLDQNEQALRNFVAINAPHTEVIQAEIRKRLEYQDASYEGQFDAALIDQWKAELLNQVEWAGTCAARDAAKALFQHELFKGTLTLTELQRVGQALPNSAVGSVERSYMCQIVRRENSAIPALAHLITMAREETSQACVGNISNLMLAHPRASVVAQINGILEGQGSTSQQRVNALQLMGALKYEEFLANIHGVLESENGSNFDKDVIRGALLALKEIPSATSEEALEAFMASDICTNSWELTRRALLAYAMIDSTNSNNAIATKYQNEQNEVRKKFLKQLLPVNKRLRRIILVFNED